MSSEILYTCTMSSPLSPQLQLQALQEVQRRMDVSYQLEKLELERQLYYDHLIETKDFLLEELKTHTGKDQLDGWIVCGSGLASLPSAKGVTVLHRIPVGKIPHWFAPQAPGHGKEVLFAEVAGKLVGIATGRAHIYDTDYSPTQLKMITAPLRVAKGLGISWLITTNAAGAMDNDSVRVGDMAVDVDYVNQHGVNPLLGPNDVRLGQRFPAKANTVNQDMLQILAQIVPKDRLHLGIYTLASNAPMYEGLGDLLRGRYVELTTQNATLLELHGMSFALEAMVMQHFNEKPSDVHGFDRPVPWIGLTAVTNVIPSVMSPTLQSLLEKKQSNPNPTSEQEVLDGAKVAEKMFIPAIVELIEKLD